MISIWKPQTVYEQVNHLFANSSTAQNKLRVGLYKIHELGNLGLDSKPQLCYFLGNVLEEVGYYFRDKENLNYSEKALKKTFKVFRHDPNMANKYGRNSRHKANQKMIANIAYANRGGNGSVASGDGWAYRGMGAMQITFKNNNEAINQYAKDHFNGLLPDFVEHPDLKNSVEWSLVSGALYWAYRGLGDLSKSNKVNIVESNKIVRKINRYTGSYTKRWNNINNFSKLIV